MRIKNYKFSFYVSFVLTYRVPTSPSLITRRLKTISDLCVFISIIPHDFKRRRTAVKNRRQRERTKANKNDKDLTNNQENLFSVAPKETKERKKKKHEMKN